MIPHLTTIPRCDTHPWSLLTGDGECPQCTREADRIQCSLGTLLLNFVPLEKINFRHLDS